MNWIAATHNRHKLTELARVLTPLGIRPMTGEELGISLTEAEETGTTFEENAWLKAHLACEESGLPAIADDSGLSVDCLGGEPGVYSARYAGEGAPDSARIEKLLNRMRDIPADRRGAKFVCAICCVFPDGHTVTARGECAGTIAFAPAGEGGFGYDPVFLTGDGRTFAQLSASEKDAISHRGTALRLFAERIKEDSAEI